MNYSQYHWIRSKKLDSFKNPGSALLPWDPPQNHWFPNSSTKIRVTNHRQFPWWVKRIILIITRYMYIVYCILYIVYCIILYIVYCILYKYCILYIYLIIIYPQSFDHHITLGWTPVVGWHWDPSPRDEHHLDREWEVPGARTSLDNFSGRLWSK